MKWNEIKKDYQYLKNIAKNTQYFYSNKTIWDIIYSNNVDGFTILAKLKLYLNREIE